MRNIAYKLSGRGAFVTSMLLVLTALVCRPALPVITARAEPDTRPATRGGQQGGVPIPPIGFGGGGGAKIDAGYLAKYGPYFAAKFIMDSFNFMGLVKGGVPIAFEYELQAGSTASITIQHAKNPKQAVTISLPPTNGEIKQVKSTLPNWLGEKPEAGVFIVKAVKNGADPKADAGFFLYGMGVGDEAVGSLVIDQAQFRPSPIHPKLGEKTRYSFRALRSFNSATVDFRVVVRNSDGLPSYESVNSKSYKNGLNQGQVVEEEWNGMNSKGRISRGVHRFMVRAWRGLKRNAGGDWTFVYTKERVVVEER